ncbi:MAG: hypothetical protein ABIP78_01745 [Pyrinomonadaceae bacterium]
MGKKSAIFALVLILVGTGVYFYSYHNRDLRGWQADSPDGKTYFVLDDSNGKNCPPIFIDGREWPVEIGAIKEIKPGIHQITCGSDADLSQGIEFEVQEGTTYHFDYWGP